MHGGVTNKMALLGSVFLVLVLIYSRLEHRDDVVLAWNKIGFSTVYLGKDSSKSLAYNPWDAVSTNRVAWLESPTCDP